MLLGGRAGVSSPKFGTFGECKRYSLYVPYTRLLLWHGPPFGLLSSSRLDWYCCAVIHFSLQRMVIGGGGVRKVLIFYLIVLLFAQVRSTIDAFSV